MTTGFSLVPLLIFVGVTCLAGFGGFVAGRGGATSEVARVEPAAIVAKRKAARLRGKRRIASTGSAPSEERLVADLFAGDPGRLLAGLREIVAERSWPPLVTKIYRDAIIERLVDLGAGDQLLAVGELEGSDRKAASNAVLEQLVATDLPGAEAFVANLPTGRERAEAMAVVLAALGRTDPARGLARIERDAAAQTALTGFFRAWAENDPVAALTASSEADDPSGWAYDSALATWVQADEVAALRWVEQVPPGERGRALNAYLGAAIRKDPELALQAMIDFPEAE